MRWITVLFALALCISATIAEETDNLEPIESAEEEFDQPELLRPEHKAEKRFDFFHKKHTKNGLFSPVPTFSQGIDYPVVKHSYLKSFIVDYPKKSIPLGVKIPFKNSGIHIKYPVHGHGLKVPSIQKPIHIPIKPGWAPKCPQPSVPTLIPANTVPAVTPLFPVRPIVPLPNPVVPVLPKPLLPLPSPTVPVLHRPLLPLPKPFIPVHPAPVLPVAAPAAPLIPSVLRPGNSVQSSYFATFPKYPIGLKPLHLIPQHVPAAPLPLAPLPLPARPVVQYPVQYPLRPVQQIPVHIPQPAVHIPQTTVHIPQPKPFIPQGTNIHVTGVENNVWTPMISPNGDSGLPYPHQPPQYIPQEPEPQPDNTFEHEHEHQGYHYPRPSNQPLLEDLHSHFREQLRKQEEQYQLQEEQQYLSANQQASADPQHEPQFPQAFPAHHLSGKPIVEAFGNIFNQRLRLPQH